MAETDSQRSDSFPREFGVVGLGRMGGGLAAQALDKGYRVAGLNKGPAPEELRAHSRFTLLPEDTPAGFTAALRAPRVILLYVQAGALIDRMIESIGPHLEPGDLLVDGGNSYWGDSIRRHRLARERFGIDFVDLGTSGGVEGARNGACFMAGARPEAFARLEPILRDLAVPGGYAHAGPPGTGHYSKLVHNGIEFGMLQAIGEGVDLLERFPLPLNIERILSCYRHGSVIRSWLMDLMHTAYAGRGGLSEVPGYVEDTGEVNWLVDDALRLEVPIPVITQSVIQLLASRDDRRNWASAVAMMRNGFGGHPFGQDVNVAAGRRTCRVGPHPDDVRCD